LGPTLQAAEAGIGIDAIAAKISDELTPVFTSLKGEKDDILPGDDNLLPLPPSSLS
jgi:hypothetical protein